MLYLHFLSDLFLPIPLSAHVPVLTVPAIVRPLTPGHWKALGDFVPFEIIPINQLCFASFVFGIVFIKIARARRIPHRSCGRPRLDFQPSRRGRRYSRYTYAIYILAFPRPVKD